MEVGWNCFLKCVNPWLDSFSSANSLSMTSFYGCSHSADVNSVVWCRTNRVEIHSTTAIAKAQLRRFCKLRNTRILLCVWLSAEHPGSATFFLSDQSCINDLMNKRMHIKDKEKSSMLQLNVSKARSRILMLLRHTGFSAICATSDPASLRSLQYRVFPLSSYALLNC